MNRRRRVARAQSVASRLGHAALMALLGALPADAQTRQRELAFEAFAGGAWNLPSPLEIEQDGVRVALTARYRTDPLTPPIYWSMRVSHGTADGPAVEVELNHHKLFLDNPKAPLERLEVTHGYNLLTGNVARPLGAGRWRAGIGAVIAHVEGRIGGRAIEAGGYHVAGPVALVGMGRRYTLRGGGVALTAAPEVRLTASWARVTHQHGSAFIPNVALHLLGGLGVRRRW